MEANEHQEGVRRLHEAGRNLVGIVQARLGGDDEGAMQLLGTMSPADLHLALWCCSGLVGAALETEAGTDAGAFLAAVGKGVDASENRQINTQENNDHDDH